MNNEIVHLWARSVLKAELGRAAVTYDELASRLRALGFDESEPSVRNKIARGTFSAGFMGACLAALNVDVIRLDLLDFARRHETEPTLEGFSRAGIMPKVYKRQHNARLIWSFIEPPEPHDNIFLPNLLYRKDQPSTALVCGNCESELFPGWRVDDAVSVFAGKSLVGQCAVCRAFVGIPGSTVHVKNT